MLCLTPLGASDVARIRDWPSYPEDMAQMDYALREGGWLDESRAETFSYAARDGEDLVGFTMLVRAGTDEAEFRIALRADRTGRGLGAAITLLTLRAGFEEHRFSRIHLIVRKNNLRGIALYRRIGFRDRGECRRDIGGVAVDFWLMNMEMEEFGRLERTGSDNNTR